MWGEPVLGGLHCITEGAGGPTPNDLFQDPQATAEPQTQLGRSGGAKGETAPAPGTNQDIPCVQEQEAGTPEHVPPSLDHAGRRGPEAPPDPVTQGGQVPPKRGEETRPGKTGPG